MRGITTRNLFTSPQGWLSFLICRGFFPFSLNFIAAASSDFLSRDSRHVAERHRGGSGRRSRPANAGARGRVGPKLANLRTAAGMQREISGKAGYTFSKRQFRLQAMNKRGDEDD